MTEIFLKITAHDAGDGFLAATNFVRPKKGRNTKTIPGGGPTHLSGTFSLININDFLLVCSSIFHNRGHSNQHKQPKVKTPLSPDVDMTKEERKCGFNWSALIKDSVRQTKGETYHTYASKIQSCNEIKQQLSSLGSSVSRSGGAGCTSADLSVVTALI